MSRFPLLGWIQNPPTSLLSEKPSSREKKLGTKILLLGNPSQIRPTLEPSPWNSVCDSQSIHMEENSPARLFNRERTVHQILGGGFVADVMLWRQSNVTIGILFSTLAAWVVFERSGYTLLSLVSNVLLLLIGILFLWAKAAGILHRPPPPLPNLQLSEQIVNDAAAFVRSRVNALLTVSHDISLGKDPKLFLKVAACLWLISVVGGWTDFLTLGYTSLVIILTLPALYEKYEDQIDKYATVVSMELRRLYIRLDEKCFNNIRKWILEKRKLS